MTSGIVTIHMLYHMLAGINHVQIFCQ